ncbi:MAG: SBBP repeat-containing protein [Spirochaetales bacterium]|nr:SBBP repeat-containing protein [Spirochaetales bacterium]
MIANFRVIADSGPDTFSYDWVKTFGATNSDFPHAATGDAAGNVYITGNYFGAVDFDPGPDTDIHDASANQETFITKYDANGAYGWTKTLDNMTGSSAAQSIAIDGTGNIYVTGGFSDTIDFDPGPGTDPKSGGGAYLLKLNPNGDYAWVDVWSTHHSNGQYRVSIDTSGNVFLTGSFTTTTDFDPGTGVDSYASLGNSDVFILKIDPNNNYAWAKTLGGTGTDVGWDVAVDAGGNIYISGHFMGTVDFDPGSGTDIKTGSPVGDVFLTKFNADGTYGWTRAFGGDSIIYNYLVKADGLGNVYAAGNFQNTVDFDPGSAMDSRTSLGLDDIFLLRFSETGDRIWTKIIGGTDYDELYGMTVDTRGNVYLAGDFRGTCDFDPGPDLDNKTATVSDIINAFITRIDADGAYGWTHTFGGTTFMRGFAATDGYRNVYLASSISSDGGAVDFDPGPGVDARTSNGGQDVCLIKFRRQ